MTKREAAVLATLAGVSVVYDRWIIRWMNRSGRNESLTWLEVVIGVAYTLLFAALLNREAAGLLLKCFIFSGAPMALGDIERFLERKRNGIRYVAAIQGRQPKR